MSTTETCARCGHVAGARCPTCGVTDPLLGGSIWYEAPGGDSGLPRPMEVLRLCHTYVVGERVTCYTQETWDRTAGTGRWTA